MTAYHHAPARMLALRLDAAMSELTPQLAPDVLAACQAGAAEAADALGRALGGQFTLQVGEASSYAAATPPAGFAGSGLAILLRYGAAGLAILLPESSGLVPAWCGAPDATGESKLSTLAQELSMLLAPESLMADKFDARRVASLADALRQAETADGAALVTLAASSGEHKGELTMVWPLAAPEKLFESATPAPAAGTATATAPTAGANSPAPASQPAKRKPQSFAELPSYSQSLLKIPVVVSVELATKKESLDEIVEMVSGSILKFDKGCDQLLTMVVGGQQVAVGEAVKIGEKFGFRITAMTLPEERFLPVRRPKAG